MILRKPSEADFADILALEKAWSSAPWQESALSSALHFPYDFWVIELDKHIVAYGIVQCVLEDANILTLAVSTPYQHQGLGCRILKALIDSASAAHCQQLFLEVAHNNQAALALYQKFDFKQVGIRKGFYQAATGAVEGLVLSRQVHPRSE